HRLEITCRAFVVRAFDPRLRRFCDRDFGSQSVDGEADAAEPPAESAIEVKESEMQTRRNGDCHGHCNRGRNGIQMSVPEIVRMGFSNWQAGLNCGIRALLGK